jgi:two-component system NtrC family response regulator
MSTPACAVQRKIPLTENAERVHVLVISPFDNDHHRLREIFSHSNWIVYGSRNRREAAELLGRHPISVVITEAELPDGTWKDLLDELRSMPHAPLLTLTSRQATDHLWVEALNRGAFDLLMKPFNFDEVTRVVALAWRHWKQRPRKE